MRTCELEGCENSLEGKRSDAKWCSKKCSGRAGYLQNQTKAIARSNEYQRQNFERYQINQLRHRASKKGLPFDLKVGDLQTPDTCPYLGIPLERSEGYGPSPNSPAVDRIIPELGYVKGNVQVISHRANCIKQDATWEEVQAVADGMKLELQTQE